MCGAPHCLLSKDAGRDSWPGITWYLRLAGLRITQSLTSPKELQSKSQNWNYTETLELSPRWAHVTLIHSCPRLGDGPLCPWVHFVLWQSFPMGPVAGSSRGAVVLGHQNHSAAAGGGSFLATADTLPWNGVQMGRLRNWRHAEERWYKYGIGALITLKGEVEAHRAHDVAVVKFRKIADAGNQCILQLLMLRFLLGLSAESVLLHLEENDLFVDLIRQLAHVILNFFFFFFEFWFLSFKNRRKQQQQSFIWAR